MEIIEFTSQVVVLNETVHAQCLEWYHVNSGCPMKVNYTFKYFYWLKDSTTLHFSIHGL